LIINVLQIEKSIYALALLCGLVRSEVPFVFKGGTSLILLLNAFRRLSIDIDISTETSRGEYEPALKQINKGDRHSMPVPFEVFSGV
jgi:predicted nucleotidyltransferase component of viral defense system